MDFSLRTLSLVKVLIPIISGILLERFYPNQLQIVTSSLAIISIIFWGFSYLSIINKGILRSISILVLFFGLGYYLSSSKNNFQPDYLFESYLSKKETIVFVPNSFPKTSNSTRLRGHVIAIGQQIIGDPPLIEIYFRDSLAKSISPLDTVIAEAQIERAEPSMDKYAFDYEKFLKEMGIHYQAWSNREISIRNNMGYTGLNKIRYGWRKTCLSILKRELSDENYSIAAALLLGYKNALDKDIQKDFAKTGAIHVLAVSGLHVGIIVLLLNLLLFFIPNKTMSQKVLKGVLLVIGVTVYALMTGLAPPVIRAAIIFGTLFIGRLSDRTTNSINLLALAALAMLIFDPNYIFHLSFQLSFSAVLGIIIFFPIIHKALFFENWILKHAWSLCAVSLAAQVFIFPLSLFYFHQFPVYFMISSLIAIPMAMTIISIGLLLFIFYRFEMIGELLSYLLNESCQLLYTSIQSFDHLPDFNISNIWIDNIQLSLLYIHIIAISVYIFSRRSVLIKLSLNSLIVLIIYCNVKLINQKNQFQLSSYEQDEKIIDIIIGQKVYEVSQDIPKKKKIFLTENFRLAHGITEVEIVEVDQLNALLIQEK